VNTLARSVRRELAWLRRSPWDFALVTLAPLATLLVLAALFLSSSPRTLPLAVVDADHSAMSRQFVRNLRASAQVEVLAEPTDLQAAQSLARSTAVWAVVLVPQHLERDALAGRPASIVAYRNASFYSVGALASRGIGGAVDELNRQLRPQQLRQHNLPVVRLEMPRVQATVLFNPQLSYEWFLEALLQPGILHVLLSCAVAVALGREIAAGSLAQWNSGSSYASAAAALAGKLAPYVLVFTLWQLAGTAWLCGWRGWGVHGSLALLAASQFALYACYAALAAVLALLLRDTYTTLSAVALYGGPAMTFSDATLPVIGAPLFTRLWSHALPFSAYIKLQMEQMFMGSPAAVSLPWLGLLGGVALAMFSLAAWLLQRSARRAPQPGHAAAAPTAGPRQKPGYWQGLGGTLRSVATTRPALMILVLAGVLYGFYYPAAYQHEVATQLPIAVVDLDQSPPSRQVVARLLAAPQLSLASQTQDFAAARAQLLRREIDAIVLIPPDFERGVLSGTQPDAVAFYVNGAYIVRASAIGEALQAVLGDAVAHALEGPARALGLPSLAPVQLIGHPLFNTREGYGSYVVPGVAVIIVHQTLLMGVVLLMGERRRLGQTFASATQLLGSASAFVLIGLCSALFYFGFVFWFQDYPRGGEFGAMALASLLFVGATVAFALLLGSFFDRGERSAQFLAASSALIFFLSGLPWPFSAMPPALAALAQALPATAGVQALVKVNQMQAQFHEIGPELLTLALLIVVYGALAWWRWRVVLARRPAAAGALASA